MFFLKPRDLCQECRLGWRGSSARTLSTNPAQLQEPLLMILYWWYPAALGKVFKGTATMACRSKNSLEKEVMDQSTV